MVSDAYDEEARALFTEFGLPCADGPPPDCLRAELARRNLRVEQFQRTDFDPPVGQGARLLNADGIGVAEATSEHRGRSVLLAFRQVLERERG